MGTKKGLGGFYFVISLILLSISSSTWAQDRCEKPWLFFDLGNVFIDTHDWNHLRYIPGALEYLHELKTQDYSLGLIVNIPEDWGRTHDEKVAFMKDFIAKPWDEPAPFEWDLFQTLIIPENNSERKPAPVLFQRALQQASPCPAIYQGENATEIQAASRVGLHVFRVGHTLRDSFYLPANQINRFIRASSRPSSRRQSAGGDK